MPGVNPPSAELPESEAARYPLPGNERLRAEGKSDKAKGAVAGDIKDAARQGSKCRKELLGT
jgi:hypothetical protein